MSFLLPPTPPSRDAYTPHLTNPPPPVTLGLVTGEGVGIELAEAALRVISAMQEMTGRTFTIFEAPGALHRDEWGMSLTDELRAFYQTCFTQDIPILHGPCGGRYVYQLRHEFQLAVKFTPIEPRPALANVALVTAVQREQAAGRPIDIMILRDNLAGFYQGEFGWESGDSAFQTARYAAPDVERLIAIAVENAQHRRGRLAVITKPGGLPSISKLWRDAAEHVRTEAVDVEFLDIDNASYQLIADPGRFDVIVAPNMMGDVLGDTAASLLGSRGMSYSANFGYEGQSVYQTAHGAAHDLAGKNTANPIAHLLTLANLIDLGFGDGLASNVLTTAIDTVLSANVRTADIAASDSTVVSCSGMVDRIVDQIEQLAS